MGIAPRNSDGRTSVHYTEDPGSIPGSDTFNSVRYTPFKQLKFEIITQGFTVVIVLKPIETIVTRSIWNIK